MITGYDYSKGSHTVCLAKEWSHVHAGCAILLSADGTPMARDAVLDGVEPALKKAAATLQHRMEQIAGSSGVDDLVFVSTHLISACKQVNREILDISDFVGQGIYIGGVIMYHASGRYLMLPFGGGAVYIHRDSTLTREGEAAKDPFIRDALGAVTEWNGNILQGIVTPGTRFFLTTRPLADIEGANQMICDIPLEVSHPNTVPMLLVRELAKASRYPAAAMEIRF